MIQFVKEHSSIIFEGKKSKIVFNEPSQGYIKPSLATITTTTSSSATPVGLLLAITFGDGSTTTTTYVDQISIFTLANQTVLHSDDPNKILKV